ncbi:MAG: radical SAM protein, partial [Limnochordia bacterium]|nr:radical SAM protein [Limnochordia bacterium]
ERYARLDEHKYVINEIRKYWATPDNNWRQLILRAFEELDPEVRKRFMANFFVYSGLYGIPKGYEMVEKYDCNVPWTILMDPTAACNLRCIGCWAAEYDKHDSLDLETLDRIIREGKHLGIYTYIYSGGEPLMRKDDLITLARKHSECVFLSFTNGTLVDEEFAEQLRQVGNLFLAISVEGMEAENDLRRGKGTYKRIMKAMDILKEHGVGFGFSACYHSKNTEAIASDEFVDHMVKKGCMFGWYFTYMPLGKDAQLDLLVSPEQREWMFHRVRQLRNEKPIFLMDFWNDGEFVNGCIAGGRRYLHINARGDVEPCAFIHYANMNIKDCTLLEALQSPLFQQYRKRQPFNENHLRPCPLLDNPNQLKEMVTEAKASSTQPGDQEAVEDLTDKCQDIAKRWGVVADKAWNEHLRKIEENKAKQKMAQ